MTLWLLLAACGGGPDGPSEVGATELRPARVALPTFLGGAADPDVDPPLSSSTCGALTTGGATLDGCVTAELRCDQAVVGHTAGGARRFDGAFYEGAFCFPNTTDHDGGDERVYRLVVPDGDHRVVVTLDTPCADLDLTAFPWSEPGCPDVGRGLPRCESTPRDGTARERIELVSKRATTWLVVVEGKGDEEGAFGLSVQCFDGLY